jgi:hypothetical protein
MGLNFSPALDALTRLIDNQKANFRAATTTELQGLAADWHAVLTAVQGVLLSSHDATATVPPSLPAVIAKDDKPADPAAAAAVVTTGAGTAGAPSGIDYDQLAAAMVRAQAKVS